MAVEIFLKIPGVEGESQAVGHVGEIDISSFSLGGSNPSDIMRGGGAGAGRIDVTSMSLSKTLDFSSVKLFTNCCKGTHFDGATLTVREAGGEEPLPYFVVELELVFIDSMSWGGSTGGGKPTESVAISFGKFKMTYQVQSKTGGAEKKDELGWDIKKNALA